MSDSIDLGLIPEAELVTALSSRYDHFVCMGVAVLHEQRAENPRDNIGTMRYMRRWAGHSLTCAGMCADLSNRIISELREEEAPTNE